MKVICIIDGCTKEHHSKGWCRSHYQRDWRYGDPLFVHPNSRSPKIARVLQECALDGCNTVEKTTRGYCQPHYRAFNRYGDPLGGWPSDPVVRFWMRVKKTEDESLCWEWTGACQKNKYGKYGVLQDKGKYIRAHRFAFQLANDVSLSPHEPVHHTCGNKLCVNPKHLQVVTQAENTAEMLERRFYQTRIKELEDEVQLLQEQLRETLETNENLLLARSADDAKSLPEEKARATYLKAVADAPSPSKNQNDERQ